MVRRFEARIPPLCRGKFRSLCCRLGEDAVAQEARVAACRAARKYDPAGEHAGIDWMGFAFVRVRGHLLDVASRYAGEAGRVWAEMPATEDGHQPDPEDHRTPEPEQSARLLSLWCDPDNCEQRQALTWTERVMLYLRTVEGLNFTEVGNVFGLTHTRCRLIWEDAEARLAAFRVQKRRAAEATRGGG